MFFSDTLFLNFKCEKTFPLKKIYFIIYMYENPSTNRYIAKKKLPTN